MLARSRRASLPDVKNIQADEGRCRAWQPEWLSERLEMRTSDHRSTTGSLRAPVFEEMLTEEISQLSLDHPGANDVDYRTRRDFIARLARDFREKCRVGERPPIPRIDYTEAETEVWKYVFDQLEEVQSRRACSFYLEARRHLGIKRESIPQLEDMDRKLREMTFISY